MLNNNKIVDYTLKYINKSVDLNDYKIFDKISNELSKDLLTKEDIDLHIDIDNDQITILL